MICCRNGNCIMNDKIHAGVDFCISPTCIYLDKELKSIAEKISVLLKKDDLSSDEKIEITCLKTLYKYLSERR